MTPPAAQLSTVGGAIDRLVTVEARLGAYSRGVAGRLYEAASAAQGSGPLVLRAARALRDASQPGAAIVIATGAGHREHMPAGETDGPLGAVALGRALARGLAAEAVFVTAPEFAGPLAAAAAAADLAGAPILHLASDESARDEALALLDRHRPAAVIAIEALAPNKLGVAHTASGLATVGARPRVEELVREARRLKLPTVGIGDNGNEIGFGLIEPAVRAVKAFGDRCRCPCGGGIASAVACDVLVAANVSNWGAYGVAAMLAVLLDNEELVHDAELERRMLEGAVAAGAVDGSTGKRVAAVDGSGIEVQQAVLRLLGEIVHNGLAEPPERPF